MIDVGSVIANKYRLVRLLGEGGMGSVYEAQHLTLGSPVAVKLLHPELSRRGGLVERFLQEARVAAQIRSPHVVRVSDVDRTSDGHAYIVMDLLVGEPLAATLQRQGRLPIPVAFDYTSQILEALEVAHAIGVIHRDLKPENVFVTTESGRPLLKIIDFGIAKARRGEAEKTLTVAGSLMGTAEYMAPEQARSAGAVDARADIYAVVVMLYEMIAGVRPVTGEDARDVASKVERGEVVALLHVAPDTPREIAGLVHHAMAPRPEMRFGSAAEMRAALAGALAPKPGSRVPVAPGSSPVLTPSPAPVLTPAPAAAPAAERVRTERAIPI
ncbi:MAG: serine/threonine-protein kinase, partial [Polyangiaceae bacterium]